MSSSRASLAEDYKLRAAFEAVRKRLLNERFVARWDKPIAYWVLSSDRRLPRAFLGRTVGELLKTPFANLIETPGVGQKKMAGLIQLLRRAANDEAEIEPAADPPAEAAPETFDPDCLSEGQWDQWRETVRRLGLEATLLGRATPSLCELPSVIWRTPLREYLDCTLGELRQRRTHGEKRVRAVLQTFHEVHSLLGRCEPQPRLGLRLLSRNVQRAEAWVQDMLVQSDAPSVEEMIERLVRPLLDQIRCDIGDQVAEIAAARLGIDGALTGAREQAEQLGVTRARVYQIFDDCAEVMQVRWPEGRFFLRQFAERVENQYFGFGWDLIHSLRGLLFPDRKPRTDGPAAGTAGPTVGRHDRDLSHVDTSL